MDLLGCEVLPALLVTSTLTAELRNGVTWAVAPAGNTGFPCHPQGSLPGREAGSIQALDARSDKSL